MVKRAAGIRDIWMYPPGCWETVAMSMPEGVVERVGASL